MIYLSHSTEETYQTAHKIAEQFKNSGGIIALMGDLGAGKTTFTQGFALALGIREKVISPTFVIMRQHSLPNDNRVLYHLDLYRLESESMIKEIGLTDLWNNPENIILIEWAEKIEHLLPKDAIRIHLRKLGENEREIEVI